MSTGVVQGYRRTIVVQGKYRGKDVHAYNNNSVLQEYPSSIVIQLVQDWYKFTGEVKGYRGTVVLRGTGVVQGYKCNKIVWGYMSTTVVQGLYRSSGVIQDRTYVQE